MSADGGLTPEDQRTKRLVPMLTSTMSWLKRRDRPRIVVPHPGSTATEQSVAASKSGALRAGIFGVNDGLVSNLSLIMGVAGASAGNSFILLSGIAGLLAGAFSMGAGEFVSMKVQRETFERLIHLEAHEIAMDPREELEELAGIYEGRGLSPELARDVATTLMQDPKTALDTHAREELGLDPDQLGSPWSAAISSFFLFVGGAIVPLLAFFFTSGDAAVAISAILSGATLFAVGALMSVFTGRAGLVSGSRMLLIGAGAAVVTFLVGKTLDVAIG